MTGAMRSTMYQEAAEAPRCVDNQLQRNAATLATLADRLRGQPPTAMVTIARGSSDHAATYARYLVETRLGILSSSLSPSIFSVFEAPLSLRNMLCLAISQSGRSPDLLAAARAARDSGAIVVALVNDQDSPLAETASIVLPQGAGPEKSAAATKSFITSVSAIAQMVALWSGDEAMEAALTQLPSALSAAWEEDWSPCRDMLGSAEHSTWVAGCIWQSRRSRRTSSKDLHDPRGSLQQRGSTTRAERVGGGGLSGLLFRS